MTTLIKQPTIIPFGNRNGAEQESSGHKLTIDPYGRLGGVVFSA